jgi:heptosyltransferase-2
MLRQQQFDLAILFQNAFEAAFLAWLAGIPSRYGYATDGRVFFLTHPVAVPDRRSLTHQVAYYWNLLKPLGAAGGPQPPALTVSMEEEHALTARLAAEGVTGSDVVIGVNPGSTYGGAKRWLPERFAEVAQRVSREIEQARGRRVAVMILGARGEEALGRDIADRIGGRSVVLSGQTAVRELMVATKRCSLLLTNDTGPMHIAAAFGVPVVAVFGPTDWQTTSPFGQAQGIVREPVDCAPCLLRECPIDHRCMTRLSADRVYEAALKQLGSSAVVAGSANLSGATEAEAQHMNLLAGVTVFLDRDGTLNPDPGYIKSPDQFELFPGVPEALVKLKTAGARLIVLTNQSGIARGLLSVDDLERIHEKMRQLLARAGISFDAIYVCPHHPDEGCRCRKPATGMIDQARREHDIDLSRSYVIGDHTRDMQLARRVGVKGIFVTTGNELEQEQAEMAAHALVPDKIAASLTEAADWIVSDAHRRKVSGLMHHGASS